jgi:hypothetical protein
MLVFTGSREHTESEYQNLLHRAGLTLVKTTPMPHNSAFSRPHLPTVLGRVLWFDDAWFPNYHPKVYDPSTRRASLWLVSERALNHSPWVVFSAPWEELCAHRMR